MKRFFVSIILMTACALSAPAYAEQEDANDGPMSLTDVRSTLNEDMSELPRAQQYSTRAFDAVMVEIEQTLTFAETAFANGNEHLGTDAMIFARGLSNLANQTLLGDKLVRQANRNRIPGRNLKPNDVSNIRNMLTNMAETGFRVEVDPHAILSRLQDGGLDVASMSSRLSTYKITAHKAIAAVSSDTDGFATIASKLDTMIGSTRVQMDISEKLSHMFVELGPTLRDVTDTIKGMDTDTFVHEFDRISRDLGFRDFNDLIDAINEAYGLNLNADAIKAQNPR